MVVPIPALEILTDCDKKKGIGNLPVFLSLQHIFYHRSKCQDKKFRNADM